jgi:hypothetical protein
MNYVVTQSGQTLTFGMGSALVGAYEKDEEGEIS